MDTIPCGSCGKLFSKMGMGSHVWRTHGDGRNFVVNTSKAAGWNKGLTKESNAAIRKYAEKNSQLMTGRKGHPHTADARARLSVIAKQRGLGGWNKGGKGIRGWYRGYWCDSSWELAWVVFNLEHELPFERNHKKFCYEDEEGKPHTYLPDFLVGDHYVEIKGYIPNQEILKRKLAATDRPVLLLLEKDMAPVLEYVRSKYGTNFTKLYEVPA